MGKAVDAYLAYLAAHPERIDANLQWTFCTVVVWLIIWKFRERILTGMEGANKFLEGNETIVFITLFTTPPLLFYVMFFFVDEGMKILAMWACVGIEAYTVTGRYIFDWGLAFITRQSKVTSTVDPPKDLSPNVQVNVTQQPATT